MQIRKGTTQDIDELATLYDDLNDYLECHTNYPGWSKGIYPIREDAEQGIQEENLFIALQDNKIVGTLILRHKPEEAYGICAGLCCQDQCKSNPPGCIRKQHPCKLYQYILY